MMQNNNDKEWRFAFISVLAAIPIITQSIFDLMFLGSIVPMIVLFFASTIVQLMGISLFVGFLTDVKNKKITTYGIIAISSISAWGLSLIYWVTEGSEAGAAYASIPAISIPLTLIGKFLQAHSVTNPKGQGDEGSQLLPQWAIPRKLGVDQDRILATEITQGQLLQINTYTLAPVDGLVTEGIAQFTSDIITGGPLPRHRGPGDRVLAGEECIGGSVVIQATRDGIASRLAEALIYTRYSSDFNHKKGQLILI